MSFRKTITFKPHIYAAIQARRANCLLKSNEDISFTEMVNILIEKLLVMEGRFK